GVEQLARHAQAIAAQHKLVAGRTSARLLTRLDQNEKVLRAFNRATLAVDQSRRVTPAAEWLLDNFYLIEDQIQLARRHLPEQYSRELPRLANGPSAGFLRVYDIVLELIAHVDAQIDADSLSAFVAECCQRLSRLDPALHLARGWLEQHTLEQGLSVEQLVHQENQSQASDQVSVSHSISSLRLLSAIDWKEFVETLSLVEQTLR